MIQTYLCYNVQMIKIHPKYYSVNALNVYGIIVCAGLLSASAYFQIVMGMQPCPLCIVQRMMLVVIGLLLMLQLSTENVIADRIIGVTAFLAAGIGSVASGRQVWLQFLPADQIPVCGPNLDFMLKNLPITEAFRLLLEGSGDCAVVQWSFLGLSMPEWTLAVFIAYMLMCLINLYRI